VANRSFGARKVHGKGRFLSVLINLNVLTTPASNFMISRVSSGHQKVKMTVLTGFLG